MPTYKVRRRNGGACLEPKKVNVWLIDVRLPLLQITEIKEVADPLFAPRESGGFVKEPGAFRRRSVGSLVRAGQTQLNSALTIGSPLNGISRLAR